MQSGAHSAEASALGFYYQTLFALLVLFQQNTDQVAVSVEQLDGVQLTTDGEELLFQLKHSFSETPTPISLKSRAFWKTIKAWIDILDEISLPETALHLITVGSVPQDDSLQCLLQQPPNINALVAAMVEEAQRVKDDRDVAKSQNGKLPHADRAPGCLGSLELKETMRMGLCSRIRLGPGSLNIAEIEPAIKAGLSILPAEQRPIVAEKLVAWWNREIIYSFCGNRNWVITRLELQSRILEVVGELEREGLSVDSEQMEPLEDYQPDGTLTGQINLVEGIRSDVSRAIREEWRARSQRSRWIEASAGNATKIDAYDKLLGESWSDRHTTVKEECETKDEASKELDGLNLLRWSHNDALISIRPIEHSLTASYYVRGSMQILAVNLKLRGNLEGVTGYGFVGPTRAMVARAPALNIGGLEIKLPPANLSVETSGVEGADFDGNIGAPILRLFTCSYDLPHTSVYLEPNIWFNKPELEDHSGLVLDTRRAVAKVLYVYPDSLRQKGELQQAISSRPRMAMDSQTTDGAIRLTPRPARSSDFKLTTEGRKRKCHLSCVTTFDNFGSTDRLRQ